MKKVLLIIILFVIGIYFLYSGYSDENNDNFVNNDLNNEEVRGVFISYIDYSPLKGKDEELQKQFIDQMIDNVHSYGLNNVVLQVRPFADAIYESNLFETSSVVALNEGDALNFDILEYFIAKCHEKKISLYAWINPYRIRNTSDTSSISEDSYFYDWINSNDIEVSEGGIYFNPASSKVLELILDGVKEVVSNYDVDGVLYDDYFYPSKSIDEKNYKDYVNNGGKLTIEEYRIDIINTLIKESYKTVKSVQKDVLFGISPSGNIENNLNEEYLDVEYILKNEGYLDFIIPQIYYGFDNSNKPYIETVDTWNDLIKTDTKLYIALSIYKAGLEDTFAGTGKNEWIENDNIIKKQVIIARNKSNYNGFFVFRYSYLFNDFDNDVLKLEVDNLKNLID